MDKTIFTASERKILQKLSTPQKVQDFLSKLPHNFERSGDTVLSPRRVMREKHAQCIEGALFAAVALWYHGMKPLILDLASTDEDYDHIIVPFKQGGHWGAISKTNHAVLRYREPVYKNIRELAMSYFHEYTTDDGKKTLRRYSDPIDLSKIKNTSWITSEKNLWHIVHYINRQPHHAILNRTMMAHLRKADPVERVAGKLLQWKK